MKRLILALSLAAAALSGCAQLKEAFNQPEASGGQTAGDNSPYPKSSSNLGLF